MGLDTLPPFFSLNSLICIFQIYWRCVPQSCSWETLNSRKRETRSRPPCLTTPVRDNISSLLETYFHGTVNNLSILQTKLWILVNFISRDTKVLVCAYQHINFSLCSGPEGVSPSGHQCDRLHPCHPNPSNQSGQRDGAEGTDQRAGAKSVLCENIRNKYCIEWTNPLPLTLMSYIFSVCVYLMIGRLCNWSPG